MNEISLKRVKIEKRRIKNKLSSFILLLAILTLVASTSGCIDIYYAKSLLYKPPPKEIKYQIKIKGTLSGVWDVDLVSVAFSRSFDDFIKEGENTTEVINGTQFLVVDYSVIFNELPEGLQDILDKFNVTGLPDRYFKIELYSPDGKVFWTEEAYETTHNTSGKILTPQSGKWTVKIKAVGYGSKMTENFQDSFAVTVTVKEPKN